MTFRYDLGLEIACWDSLPQNQRFWFDAYAALGARVLKEYGDRLDVGFVRELERRARACVDNDNESQVKALGTMRDQPIRFVSRSFDRAGASYRNGGALVGVPFFMLGFGPLELLAPAPVQARVRSSQSEHPLMPQIARCWCLGGGASPSESATPAHHDPEPGAGSAESTDSPGCSSRSRLPAVEDSQQQVGQQDDF
jgi:hypothetical protein